MIIIMKFLPFHKETEIGDASSVVRPLLCRWDQQAQIEVGGCSPAHVDLDFVPSSQNVVAVGSPHLALLSCLTLGLSYELHT